MFSEYLEKITTWVSLSFAAVVSKVRIPSFQEDIVSIILFTAVGKTKGRKRVVPWKLPASMIVEKEGV